MVLLTSWPLFSAALCFALGRSAGAPHVAAAHYSSHVSFATPARSFSHGVGHPPPLHSHTLHGNFRQKLPSRLRYTGHRSLQGLPDETITQFQDVFQGYPRERPAIPFPHFAFPQANSLTQHSHVAFGDNALSHVEGYYPLFPVSPYRVDSPNAEPVWPEGLLIPPSLGAVHTKNNPHLTNFVGFTEETENKVFDPYYLDGVDAVRAIARIKAHGELFHHEIPHIRALLANQRLRLANGLKPNRLGSIRPTSPWHRL